jgi:hypothetical protein
MYVMYYLFETKLRIYYVKKKKLLLKNNSSSSSSFLLRTLMQRKVRYCYK